MTHWNLSWQDSRLRTTWASLKFCIWLSSRVRVAWAQSREHFGHRSGKYKYGNGEMVNLENGDNIIMGYMRLLSSHER